jgi:hypothetical protein
MEFSGPAKPSQVSKMVFSKSPLHIVTGYVHPEVCLQTSFFIRSLKATSKGQYAKRPVHVSNFPKLHCTSCSDQGGFMADGRRQLSRNHP